MSRSLDDLCSIFRPLACDLIAQATEQGICVTIVDTLRTDEEHKANLAAGTSWISRSKHQPQPRCCNKSHAIDIAPLAQYLLHGKNKIQWDANDPSWSKLGAIGKSLGLRWGGDWKQRDLGHFELMTTADLV